MSQALLRVTFIAMILTITGCLEDGERGNPLDPLSSNFLDEGQVGGRVTDRSRTGIPGATATLSPGGLSASTDGSGAFLLEDVASGQYTMTVQAEGYAETLDTVTVAPGLPASVDLELNGLPVLEDWTINTAHISRWWPLEDLFQIEIVVTASDVDGVFDLDRVWLEIPDYTFADTLQTTQTVGTFASTLDDLSLPTPTIHTLLGRPMHISARDRLSKIVASPDLQLVRVIDETPLAVDEAFQTGPQDCLIDSTGNGAVPLVQWNPLFLPYPFTHRVDVIRVDAGLESEVQRLEDIPADSTSVTAQPIPPGEYYWTVAVVDEFQNRSRSKQVGFCVIP